MARGAGGGIPGNDPGQGSTSPSTFTHVLGVSGAPTGTVGGAADGRRNMGNAHGGPKRRPMVKVNVLSGVCYTIQLILSLSTIGLQ